MKLKAYSRNNPLKHLISHTVKRYLWLPFVMLALSMAVFVGTELVMEDRRLSSILKFETTLRYAFKNAEIWEFFPIYLLLSSVFIAYVMFSFVFKKKSSSMMLLTGVSRVELFVSKYVFGLLSMLIPTLISFFALLLLGARNVEIPLSLDKNAFIVIAMIVMLVICSYTVAVIAISLCGRKLEYFAVSTVFFIGGMAILSFIGTLGNAFLHGFAYPIRSVQVNYAFEDMFKKYSWLSPASIFNSAFNEFGYSTQYTDWSIYFTRLIWFSVFTLALIPLSVWLFKRRNAEFDGKANANKPVSAVCSILFALTLSSLVFIIGGTFVNTIIVLAVFTLLALLFYAFFNGTVREMFKAVKFILPITAAFAVFVLVLNFDLIGYSKRIPDIDKVESVVVSYKGNNDSSFNGGRSGTNFHIVSSLPSMKSLPALTEKEDIQTAMNIHEKIIADGSMTPSNKSLENYSDTVVYVDYNIVYKLKNGREVIRTYSVMKLSTLYSTLEIDNTSAYREYFEDVIKSGNNKPFYDESGELVVDYDRFSFHASNNMLSDATEITLTTDEKIKLLEAICADKLEEPFDEEYHPTEDCLGVLWYRKPNANSEATLGLPDYIAVDKNDTNILTFLESKGLSEIFDTSYEIKSIKLYSYNYYCGRKDIKEMAIDRAYMAYYNVNVFEFGPYYQNPYNIIYELGEVPKEDWDEILNKSYLSYFRDVGNKYAVITMTNANGEERVVTKFIPE